ncbi:toprim domain-containing protein [Xylanibacter rodentium]|uniref:toprim domain-containing protein n=4 Tax=Bacteroidales TaxID=171549 RepID=UPI00258FD620|nr:toprim domain-containing protein [Xylanibacter rodentium]
MQDYQVNFKELKSRVGVDDIAYALGYRLDRKAGVGKYIELVLGEGRDRRDTIIVSNHRDKASQIFFRRDGSKGDVVTLIRENLNSFIVSGKNDWQKVAKVMARFANIPEPEFREDREYVNSAKVSHVFDKSRYEEKPVDTERIPRIFSQRGIADETVRSLAPFLSLIRDTKNENFDGYNIGFPYTESAESGIKGYEIRGMGGYKSKAAGTNSSSAAWVADLSGNDGSTVRSVFFCESAFDAMAFYQMNRTRLDSDIALVSLGGTFSDGQIAKAMERFPQAKAFDCFDNDIAGRIYGLRLMALVEGFPIKITKTEEGLKVEAKEKTFEVNPERPISAQVSENISIRHKMGQWTPPKAFKDWNDCLMNKPMDVVLSPNKHQRDSNLAEQRKSSLKI